MYLYKLGHDYICLLYMFISLGFIVLFWYTYTGELFAEEIKGMQTMHA